VHALLPLSRSVDAHYAQAIRVGAPKPEPGHWVRRPWLTSKVLLQLAFRSEAWDLRPGDTLSGALVVKAQESVKTAGIRVDLVCREKVEVADGKEWSELIDTKTIADARTLEPSEVEFPFEVEVPESAQPSLEIPVGEITWLVRAIVGRRFRTDTTLEQVFTVYDDRAAGSVDAVESGLFAHPPGEENA
jgi:Arrestin (or S-antigen), N-terminal domain